jgi:methionine synthase II (cobalamin-independent)
MTRLQTTTIGSLFRFSEDLHESIDEAVTFQRHHGLDLLTDGEQRADMVSYFAESFAGLGVESGVPVITGRIALQGPAGDFSKVKDLEYIRSKYPDAPVKVAITGPTTLGMTCGSRRIESHYRGLLDFSLYEDIASSLAPIARELARLGAHVQIDEPFLSQGYRDLPERVALLDRVAEDIPPERTSVHVCGFAGRQERGNLDFLKGDAFLDSGKRLGAGCMAVTPMSEAEVDRPEAVDTLLRAILDEVGPDSVAYAHPDCGLRATSKSLVPMVLRNFRAGVDLSG